MNVAVKVRMGAAVKVEMFPGNSHGTRNLGSSLVYIHGEAGSGGACVKTQLANCLKMRKLPQNPLVNDRFPNEHLTSRDSVVIKSIQ